MYDDFFDNVLPAMTQECVVVFTSQSNAQHAEELNKSIIRHQDKFTIQYSELRISGGLSDATKYYSGIRVIGFKKKAVPVKTAATTAPVKECLMIKKSAISLISYDAHYLPKSIEKYYNYVDEIVLGLDKNRTTWSKNPFRLMSKCFMGQLSQIDGDGKISIVEEDFVQSDVAIENDNYERNYLKDQCSYDWVFSFDADEMLVNPKHFFYDFCPLVEDYRETHDICMTWATPYKEIGDTTLVIAEEDGSPFLEKIKE